MEFFFFFPLKTGHFWHYSITESYFPTIMKLSGDLATGKLWRRADLGLPSFTLIRIGLNFAHDLV